AAECAGCGTAGHGTIWRLEWHDVHMHDRCAPCIERTKAARDGFIKPVRITDSFALSTERSGDVDEVPLLALTSGTKLGQERVGQLRLSVGINPLNRGLYRLPAAIVQNDGEDREPILLRYGIHGIRRGEVEGAIAH